MIHTLFMSHCTQSTDHYSTSAPGKLAIRTLSHCQWQSTTRRNGPGGTSLENLGLMKKLVEVELLVRWLHCGAKTLPEPFDSQLLALLKLSAGNSVMHTIVSPQ